MNKITRTAAKTLGEWLATASVEKVNDDSRLSVLKACWQIQDIAEETDKRHNDIIARYVVDGMVPEDKRPLVRPLLDDLYKEEIDVTISFAPDIIDQFLLSNPKWTVAQSRLISKSFA